MRFFAVFILVCLLLTGTAAAKAADPTAITDSKVNTQIGSGIYTLTAFTDCTDESAQVGTPVDMGDLVVDSIPDGARIKLDGSPWTYKHCTGGFPPTCFPMPIFSPYTGNVEVGTHSITIEKTGYNSYSGTVKICSQKLSRVKKTLTAVATTSPTTPTTTVTTTTTAATTTATTTGTTAAVTATTAASGTTTTAAGATTTASVAGTAAAPAGTGSLTVTTTPAGAAVYIDGDFRGLSPLVFSGLSPGSHTLLLKLEGYQDLSAPVSITAGTMNQFSTGLTPLVLGTTAAPATTAAAAPPAAVPTKAQSPGFEAIVGLISLAAVLYLRNGSYR
jgi:hypothetical protein